MKSRHHHEPGKRKPSSASGRGRSITGRLVSHRDGYGFVIPETVLPQVRGDIYIGPHCLGSALHGDRVLVDDLRIRAEGRAEGRIERVLERAQATIVGTFHFGSPWNYVVPYDERIPHRILVPKGQEQPSAEAAGPRPEELEDAVVNVEITRFPTATQHAMGRVLEVLGHAGDFGVDVEIIIRKHHLPHEFPPEVVREAEEVPDTAPPAEIPRRHDFRPLPIVTIDGETARDFDDAVAVSALPSGNYQLQVHIADVAYYVRPGTALDREARLRGTSVYFPDRAVPMLPPELSSGICSLQPHEDRLVLSVLMEIDGEGEILDAAFQEGVIRSAERMTYTDVNRVLEGDPEKRRRYAGLVPEFERMRELALILSAKRRRRGAIDFDLPEPVIEMDEFGTMVSIARSERNIAHRLIEEFMLAANEAVAKRLEQMGVASLYRIHEQPEAGKVVEFEEIAATFGYSLGIGPLPVKRFAIARSAAGRRDRHRRHTVEAPAGLKISPRHYQKLTDQIAGKPEERILSYLMLRSLKQACYRERNEGHFALATPCYTHFTSPIRRYPDLIVHRILRAVLASEGAVKPIRAATVPVKPIRAATARERSRHNAPHQAIPDPITPIELQEIALESSESERRAQDAERELVDWKKARFMRDKLGEEFEALITSVSKSGFFVELIDLFIEGLVPVETLTGDRYVYREQQRQWVGERTRRRFRIGDRLRVQLDRVSEIGGKMNFSVAD